MPPADLTVSDVQGVSATPDGSAVIVQAVTTLEGRRTELEISITTDIAPAVAIALLSKTAEARAERDALDPALDVLAAAVVPSADGEKVRLQLLFDKGSVLPVEMPLAAGVALQKGLGEELSSRGATRR
jgi:hypothetical protein